MSHRPPRPSILPPELRTRAVADLMMMRSIVGFIGSCNIASVPASASAAAPTPMSVLRRNRDRIRDYLERLADWPRLDGPRDPDAAAGSIGDILD